VRALEPEVLGTGHFAPIVGAATIRSELDRLHDCVAWVHDETVRRMNEGQDLPTIMRAVVPPDAISVGEGYGKVAWSVRAIWEGYAGWFHARSTTELYPVPAAAVSADLVDLAGGTGAVVAAARRRLERDEPVEALHLVEIALDAAPDDRAAWETFAAAHEALLARPEAENFWLHGWLRHQVTSASEHLG
jgi:alkyl sulfatase BDS1-like metallo-beta-lactamase superfamily hydrolase